MKTRWSVARSLWCLAFSVMMGSPCWGEPPWDIDDPGVTEEGAVTFYWAWRGTFFPDRREHALSAFSLAAGLTARLEMSVEVDAVAHGADGQGLRWGWSDASVGWKLLVAGTPAQPRLALAWQTTVPSGSRWASNRSVGHTLWASGQVRRGRGRLTYALGGHPAPRAGHASAFFGLVADLEVAHGVRLGAQAAHWRRRHPESHERRVALGVLHDVGDRVALQALVGQVRTHQRGWYAYAGTALLVPGGRRP